MKSIARSSLGIVAANRPAGAGHAGGWAASTATARRRRRARKTTRKMKHLEEGERLEGSAMDLYKEIAAACAIPDSIPVCAPPRFDAQFADRLRAPSTPTGRKFERRWLADLWAGDHVAAYGLGWLRSERALPALAGASSPNRISTRGKRGSPTGPSPCTPTLTSPATTS